MAREPRSLLLGQIMRLDHMAHHSKPISVAFWQSWHKVVYQQAQHLRVAARQFGKSGFVLGNNPSIALDELLNLTRQSGIRTALSRHTDIVRVSANADVF